MYDVPLMVARGYASLSFLHSAAEYINDLEVPAYIYHLGDFDPSGVNAGEKIEQTLREMAPDAEIYFERIAVTPEQIRRMEPADPPDQGDRQPRQRTSATSRSSWTRSSRTSCARSVEDAIERAPARRPIRDTEGGRGERAGDHPTFRRRDRRCGMTGSDLHQAAFAATVSGRS